MTVVPEQATQTKLSITECWRKRAKPAFAQLAERKLDSTLECQFTKSGVGVEKVRDRNELFAAIVTAIEFFLSTSAKRRLAWEVLSVG
jgi:hypothetical protein